MPGSQLWPATDERGARGERAGRTAEGFRRPEIAKASRRRCRKGRIPEYDARRIEFRSRWSWRSPVEDLTLTADGARGASSAVEDQLSRRPPRHCGRA